MVIMALSYAQKTGDTSQLQRYVRLSSAINIQFVLGLLMCNFYSPLS
jgi:hypothetical protein